MNANLNPCNFNREGRENSRIRVALESTDGFYHGLLGWARIRIVAHEAHEAHEKRKGRGCPRMARMIANLIHHKGTEDTKCSLRPLRPPVKSGSKFWPRFGAKIGLALVSEN
jgi:hypothetical protein